MDVQASYRYRAFLSYRSSDVRVAEWLRKKLEGYRVPRSLVGKPGARGPTPAKLGAVFRDRDDARTAEDIETVIAHELSKSEQLIVLCSPGAAEPQSWVPREIELFRNRRPDGVIHSVIVKGEPPTCFPAPLLKSSNNQELRAPLAADLRRSRQGGQDGRHRALTKLIAGLIGVEFDELWRREKRRRRRNLVFMAVAAITVSSLALYSLIDHWIAQSRQLAAQARQNVDIDVESSLRRAILAGHKWPTEEAQIALGAVLERPLLRLILHHAAGVRTAVFSRDGRHILTACGDGSAYIWDAATGALQTRLAGHTGVLNHATYSSDGRRIVTASDDGSAKVWNAENGQLIASLAERDGAVLRAAFSPDGNLVVTAGKAGAARLWDVTTSQPRFELNLHAGFDLEEVAFSPDGHWVVTRNSAKATVWDAENGRPQLSVENDGFVESATFSPDGKRVLILSDHAHLLEVQTNRRVFSLEYSGSGRGLLSGWEIACYRQLAQ